MNKKLPLLPALALLLSTNAALAIEQDEPLTCNNNAPTYYPRGDHWAKEPNGNVRKYHINKSGAPTLSLTTVKTSIDEAFSYWTSLRCNNDGNNNTPLNVAWSRGDDWPTKDRGDDINNNSFNHIIYFIDNTASWTKATGADSLTIALATNLRFTTTGYVVSSDIEFNAGNFQFRVNGNGCNASQKNPLCYDLTTIATHEIGHWFGFNHVNCVDAIMYPTATTSRAVTSLTKHESTGACKVYNPVPKNNSYHSQWGEKCSSNSDCPGGTCIVEYLGSTMLGWCTQACAKDSDCPEAYTCTTAAADANGHSTKYCKPGHRNGSSNQGNTTDFTNDLCKTCRTGADCASEFCVNTTNNSQSYCSMSCTPGSTSLGCPEGFDCLTLDSGGGACWPSSGSCQSAVDPQKTSGINEICWDYNNTPNNTSDDTISQCDSGLICFGFRNFGECVPICGDGISCPGSNYTCCYSIDQYGNCVTQGEAGQFGGCFDIRQENETCVRGDESICDNGLLCAQLESSVADNCGIQWDNSLQTARCYTMCTDKSQCKQGQTCNKCLQVSEGVGLCWSDNGSPNPAPTKRALGAACSSHDQCESALCLENSGKKACSQGCNYYAADGCPTAAANELGLTFNCLQIGTTTDGFCWPVNGPIAADDEPEEEIYGCDCRQGMSDPMSWFMVALLALLAFRPRKEPRL